MNEDSVAEQHGTRRQRRRVPGLPPDAIDPPAQQHPHDAVEAAADRDMADAEEAVSRGDGTVDQRESVAEMAEQRGQEDRRRTWIRRHSVTGDGDPDNPPAGRGH